MSSVCLMCVSDPHEAWCTAQGFEALDQLQLAQPGSQTGVAEPTLWDPVPELQECFNLPGAAAPQPQGEREHAFARPSWEQQPQQQDLNGIGPQIPVAPQLTAAATYMGNNIAENMSQLPVSPYLSAPQMGQSIPGNEQQFLNYQNLAAEQPPFHQGGQANGYGNGYGRMAAPFQQVGWDPPHNIQSVQAAAPATQGFAAPQEEARPVKKRGRKVGSRDKTPRVEKGKGLAKKAEKPKFTTSGRPSEEQKKGAAEYWKIIETAGEHPTSEQQAQLAHLAKRWKINTKHKPPSKSSPATLLS